jgi:AraC-like DNA-binding protein
MTQRRLRSERSEFFYRDCPLPGLVMFGRWQHPASVRAIPSHTHRGGMEICFLERGEQTFRVQGRLHRMRGHDQFFTLPDEVHDTADLPEERGILYWLILRFEGSKRLLGLAPAQAAQLKSELLRMPTRHFRGHPDCARLLAEMTALLLDRHGGTRRLITLQALLLRYLTLTIQASARGAHGSASPLLQRVLHYVDGHLGDPVRVARLAQVARLSESRLKARFKREIGVPPAEYWLRQKIERAVTLLPTRSITDIAYELGFSSSQYFATVFKRYQLVSPSRHPARAAAKD